MLKNLKVTFSCHGTFKKTVFIDYHTYSFVLRTKMEITPGLYRVLFSIVFDENETKPIKSIIFILVGMQFTPLTLSA